MMKLIGVTQLALAPVFVIPAVSGQEGAGGTLDAQLEATQLTIEYLAGLRDQVKAGESNAVDSIVRSTEPPRATTAQRSTQLSSLQSDLSRLRFQLDRLLADPVHLDAITSLPPTVRASLGLGGAQPIEIVPEIPRGDVTDMPTVTQPPPGGEAAVPAGPGSSVGLSSSPFMGQLTVGIDEAMREAIRSNIAPLDQVSATSRRRGDEPVAIEGDDFVADPIRLGKLLVRSERPAEALEVLKRTSGPAARYWRARALEDLERSGEAIDFFESVVMDEEAGPFARRAERDLEFLRFKTSLESRRKR